MFDLLKWNEASSQGLIGVALMTTIYGTCKKDYYLWCLVMDVNGAHEWTCLFIAAHGHYGIAKIFLYFF